MAGVKVISLDKVISSMIHHPKIDGIPLYVRVDGQMENGEGRVASTKGLRWEEASKRSYGSPDNIRRVFITHKAVYVHLYRPVVGVSNRSLKRETVFPTPLDEVYADINMAHMNGTKPNYAVRQTGLGALVKPWVCSNIEEVYFDWSILMSEDVKNLGLGDFFQIYSENKQGLLDPTPIKVLFETACMKGMQFTWDRFVRLRCVGYMSDLETIYKRTTDKPGSDSLEDMVKPWYKNAMVDAAINSPDSAVAIYNIPNVPKLNANYSIKDGIYVYDRDILKDYFSNLEARIREHARNERDRQVDNKKAELVKQVQTAKSSFEMTIDDIYAKEGVTGATLALKIALDGLPKSEKLSILNNMSSDGQARYKKLLGFGE